MALRDKLARLSTRGAAAPAATTPAREQTIDDLRRRMRAVLERTVTRPAPRPVEGPALPFVTHDTPLGPLHVRRLRLPPSHRTGRAPVRAARDADARLLSLLALDPSLAACDLTRALYLDTETTGLSGGTGTVAFLVGLAFFEEGDLVVEQLLVRNLGEEAPMLAHTRARIEAASMLVTFNGKSFDMPLLRTRLVMARIEAAPDRPHLDLLHVARRVHRASGMPCRLVGLEERVLGFVRHDDVPSGEVSAAYLHFLRTGETRALLGVVEHNAWDVVTMASLVGLYGEPPEGSALAARDLVGVARTLRRAGAHDEAFAAASLAGERGAGPESLRARAEIARARGDRDRALADLEALLREVDCDDARLALAKLYEHHVKEPARALALVEQGVAEDPARTQKRRARLERKVARVRQTKLFRP